MLVETKIVNEGVIHNVQFIEGMAAFGKIKLNVYCFATDGMVIDTGAPRLLNDFKTFFEKVAIDQVVLTHSHEDHVGGAAYIEKNYHVPIYMNERRVADSAEKAAYPFYRKFFWGKRQPFAAQAIGETIQSRNATWDVIHTPGHADDHISLINRETGQLFSGDLFVTPQTKLMLRTESVPQVISSIRKVLTYDFDEMFCCHAVYIKYGRKMLEKKLHYLEDLQEKVLELHKQGYSEKEITETSFGARIYPITYVSFGEWSSLHIIRSILRETSNL